MCLPTITNSEVGEVEVAAIGKSVVDFASDSSESDSAGHPACLTIDGGLRFALIHRSLIILGSARYSEGHLGAHLGAIAHSGLVHSKWAAALATTEQASATTTLQR